jgi:hypothetical protein
VRSIFLLAALAAASPQPAKVDTLNPAQAIGRVSGPNQSVRAVVQFRVQSAAPARGGYYLNSEKDFRSPQNLEVTVRPSAMSGLTQKYGSDLRKAMVGKTIKVIGWVHRRAVAGGKASATEVTVTHAGQILSAS